MSNAILVELLEAQEQSTPPWLGAIVAFEQLKSRSRQEEDPPVWSGVAI